jgi:hypothetical protein
MNRLSHHHNFRWASSHNKWWNCISIAGTSPKACDFGGQINQPAQDDMLRIPAQQDASELTDLECKFVFKWGLLKSLLRWMAAGDYPRQDEKHSHRE